MRKRICLILCLLCLSLRLCFFGAKCFSKTWAINPCGRHHRGGGWAYATYSKDMMMIFFLIESLYEIVHRTTYIPSTIVEEITKTSNDRFFFWPCQNIFHFHIIFHTEMEKCSDRADHTAPILFLGVLTLIFVFLCVFGANFSEAKSALVLIFTLFPCLFPSIFFMNVSNLKTRYHSKINCIWWDGYVV